MMYLVEVSLVEGTYADLLKGVALPIDYTPGKKVQMVFEEQYLQEALGMDFVVARLKRLHQEDSVPA